MSNQYIQDTSQGKYFHIMLNMDDDELNPYQYRLLGHYRRVCGQGGACWESTRTTADKTKMSAATVSRARRELVELGFITERPADFGTTLQVEIIDRMQENVARYCFSQKQPVSDRNKVFLTENKEELKKKERKEESLQTARAVGENIVPLSPVESKKTKKRDELWETVLKGSFYIDYEAQPNRVDDITRGHVNKTCKPLRAQGITVSDLKAFYADYARWRPNMSVTRDGVKLAADVNQWKQERTTTSTEIVIRRAGE